MNMYFNYRGHEINVEVGYEQPDENVGIQGGLFAESISIEYKGMSRDISWHSNLLEIADEKIQTNL